MVFPVAIKAPMVRITETMATIIGETMSDTRLKKNHISRKISAIAMGAETAIWTNIWTPKVSFATGSPVMWVYRTSDPENNWWRVKEGSVIGCWPGSIQEMFVPVRSPLTRVVSSC